MPEKITREESLQRIERNMQSWWRMNNAVGDCYRGGEAFSVELRYTDAEGMEKTKSWSFEANGIDLPKKLKEPA